MGPPAKTSGAEPAAGSQGESLGSAAFLSCQLTGIPAIFIISSMLVPGQGKQPGTRRGLGRKQHRLVVWGIIAAPTTATTQPQPPCAASPPSS